MSGRCQSFRYRFDKRLLCFLTCIFVGVFSGCSHPDKKYDAAEYHEMQDRVKQLQARGITVSIQLLKPGAKYTQMFKAGRIPAEEAYERYGAGMFAGSQGSVKCRGHHITDGDLELLAGLPALKRFEFSGCTWASDARKTPATRKALASATKLTHTGPPPPDWVLTAPRPSIKQVDVVLRADELPASTVAAALSNPNILWLRVASNSPVEGAFADIEKSRVLNLSLNLPVSPGDFRQILDCKTLKTVSLGVGIDSPLEYIDAVTAAEQVEVFGCLLPPGVDFAQVLPRGGKWTGCVLNPAEDGHFHISLSRRPASGKHIDWLESTPVTREVRAAPLPAPQPSQLPAPVSTIRIALGVQRITFTNLQNASDIRYAAALPGIHELWIGGNTDISPSKLADELSKLPHIHTACLVKSSRRAELIAALASLPNLQILKIGHPSRNVIEALRELTLKRLEVYGKISPEDMLALPVVPELAVCGVVGLTEDSLAAFLEANSSPRLELIHRPNMPIRAYVAAAQSDLQQLVVVPTQVRFTDADALEIRRVWPGYHQVKSEKNGTAHVFSRNNLPHD